VEAAAIHLRARTYIGLLLVVAAIATVIALATIAFLAAYQGLHELVWEDLPDSIGVSDPYSWYALVVTTLGGLAVGVLLRVLPGHGGQGPTEGHGIGMEQTSPTTTAGLVVISLVSLTAGASLGPEAALIAVALALGSWLAARVGRAELERVFGTSGVASVLSGLFGSPLAPATVVLEMAPVAGHNLYVFLLPVLVSAAVGLLAFDAILDGPLLDIDLPAYSSVALLHVFEALAIAAVAASIGLVLIALVRALRRALVPVGGRTILMATLGGVAIGVIALVAGEETLFSGEHELEVLLDDPAAYGAGTLLLILVGKLFALAISLETGFRGGRIFPVLFIGATVGFITSDVFERVPLAVAVACGMAGAAVAIMRLPVFIALMVAFFASPTTIPLIVLAVVVGYVLTFDKPELGGDAREEERTATPEDLGAGATPSR
jgi:H+/Cl- antiporter ClcA